MSKESGTCYNLVKKLRGRASLPLGHESYLQRQHHLFLCSIRPLDFIMEGKGKLRKYFLVIRVSVSRGCSSSRNSFVNHVKKFLGEIISGSSFKELCIVTGFIFMFFLHLIDFLFYFAN